MLPCGAAALMKAWLVYFKTKKLLYYIHEIINILLLLLLHFVNLLLFRLR